MSSASHETEEEDERRRKHNSAEQSPQPEKRARFERTADMLAKSGLLDITMKTAELIRSNQQAQQELVQLRAEVEQFTKSVLANPENQDARLAGARTVFAAHPLSADSRPPPASPKVSVIKALHMKIELWCGSSIARVGGWLVE